MFVNIKDWRLCVSDGEKYLRTAVNAYESKPEVFTPDILYNLTTMAIEKLLMGYLMYHGDMADNHTMGDMLRSVERHSGPLAELGEKLLYLDTFQKFGDVHAFKIASPCRDEIPTILVIAKDVKEFVRSKGVC